MSEKSLKQRNRILIRGYIATMASAYFIIATGDEVMSMHEEGFLSVIEEKGPKLLASTFSIVVYLFIVRLIPTEWKEFLVFWRTSECLPGHRAFSIYAKEDPRIDLKKLKETYGSIPKNPQKQNELWYRIYRKHKDSPEVMDPHKDYLLYRELTYSNLAAGLVLVLPSMLFHWISIELGPIIIAIITVLSALLAFNGRSSADRLIQNVLALESSSTRRDIDSDSANSQVQTS